jgi:hypothetical protein
MNKLALIAAFTFLALPVAAHANKVEATTTTAVEAKEEHAAPATEHADDAAKEKHEDAAHAEKSAVDDATEAKEEKTEHKDAH